MKAFIITEQFKSNFTFNKNDPIEKVLKFENGLHKIYLNNDTEIKYRIKHEDDKEYYIFECTDLIKRYSDMIDTSFNQALMIFQKNNPWILSMIYFYLNPNINHLHVFEELRLKYSNKTLVLNGSIYKE